MKEKKLEYTVEAGRQIYRDGEPCFGITKNIDVDPVWADELVHRICLLLNGGVK